MTASPATRRRTSPNSWMVARRAASHREFPPPPWTLTSGLAEGCDYAGAQPQRMGGQEHRLGDGAHVNIEPLPGRPHAEVDGPPLSMQITTTTGRWNISGATMRSTRSVRGSCTTTKRCRRRFPAQGAQRAVSRICSICARSRARAIGNSAPSEEESTPSAGSQYCHIQDKHRFSTNTTPDLIKN